MHKVKKIVALATIMLLILPVIGLAQETSVDPNASSNILTDTGLEELCNKRDGLAKCINGLYLLALSIGSFLAVFMIVLAGYKYMTAQGNAQQVENAKESFAFAFIGLIILFIAFILLGTINPDLVQFREFSDITSDLPIPQAPPGEGDPVTVRVRVTPQRIKPGETAIVSWNTQNATSCAWEAGFAGAALTRNSRETPVLNQTTEYRLVCVNENSSIGANRATGSNFVVVEP